MTLVWGVEPVVPDRLEQHGPGDDPAGMAHQHFQDLELARLQRDLLPCAVRRPGHEIETEIAHHHAPSARGPNRRVGDHLQPGEQFREGEGLGQVVVAAGAQALDPFIDPVERAQDQHRRRPAAAPQGLDQLNPSSPGSMRSTTSAS